MPPDDRQVPITYPALLIEILENRQLMAFSVDAGFADAGIFANRRQTYSAIAKASDGKLWVGGVTRGSPFILRIDGSGNPDSTFHSGTPLLFGSAGQSVKQIVQLSNGKIAINLVTSVLRLNSNGSIDTSFGVGGVTKIKNNRSVAIDNSGAFYAAGNSTIAKYSASGRIDSTWGQGGIYTYTNAPGISALMTEIQATKIIVSPGYNGRAMLCVSNGREMPKFGVLRLSSNGSLNTTFAGDGTYISPATFDPESLNDFIVLPDSQSMLLIDREEGQTEVLALSGSGTAREASIDPADPNQSNRFRFAGGTATIDQSTALGLGSDGKALLLGGFSDFYNEGHFSGAIARINPDFTLDRTTAADGDGVIATRLLNDDLFDPDYAGQPITSAFQPDSSTIYAITNNGISSAITRLTTTAVAPGLSTDGNRVIINSSAANDDITLSGDTNRIDISINGDHFSTAVSAVSKIELSTGAGDDDVNIAGSFPASSITISTRNGDDQVNINHDETSVAIQLYLGNGNDQAFSNMQSNIYGEAGNDYISGSSVRDAIFGGTGNDHLLGGDGNDYLEGNDGFDILEGEAGNDRLLGGNDNDTIVGASGKDTLYGQNGNDALAGNAHLDYLDGGPGTDRRMSGDDLDTFISIEGTY